MATPIVMSDPPQSGWAILKDDAQGYGHSGLDGNPKEWVVRQAMEGLRQRYFLGSQSPPNSHHSRGSGNLRERDHQDDRMMGETQVLLGGIDPVRVLQNGTPDAVEAAAAEAHRQAGSAFIVGAGCEVPPDTPPENLHRLARYARSHV